MKKKITSLGIGLAIGCILKLFVVDVLYVSGTSMQPSIIEGEFVIFNKLAYGLVKPFSADFFIQWAYPKKDDMIIFFMNDKNVIKRCAATAGKPLEFSSNSGYSVTVEGKIIPLKETQYQRLKYSAQVPKETVFAIGDNYAESVDSRDYGFVSVKNISGKALWR